MTRADQLPRGSHRLSRAEVTASQRGRLITAMAEAVAELGYVKTPVAEVLKRAGVSRETFYEQFSDKEDCFVAMLDAGSATLLGGMGDALTSGEADAATRVERVLTAYLKTLAANPAFARAVLVEAYAAGPRAIERRVAVQARFVDAVCAIAGAKRADERFACELFVSGVSSMVTTRVAMGETADLPKLRRPLLRFLERSELLAA